MNSLQKTLETLGQSSTGSASPAQAQESDLIDPLYVEKLAAAVDYIVGEMEQPGAESASGSNSGAQGSAAGTNSVLVSAIKQLKEKQASVNAHAEASRHQQLVGLVKEKIASAAALQLPPEPEVEGPSEGWDTEGEGQADVASAIGDSTSSMEGMTLDDVLAGALDDTKPDDSSETRTETGTASEDDRAGNDDEKRTLLAQRLRLVVGDKTGGR